MALLALFINPIAAKADNPNPSTSEIDNYISLSGSSSAKQGIQSATTSNYMSSYTSFTVEMWINPADTMTTTTGSLFTRTDMAQFDLVNGVFMVWFNSNGWKASIDTAVKARIGEWQHVAFVKSGNMFSFYLNGTLSYQVSDATNVPTNLTTSATYTSIGSNPWGGSSNLSSPQINLFAGGIDEVRTWSVARNQSEIQSAMNVKISPTTINLVGYWDFNGTSNTTTLYDRTGSFNFTIFGTPAPSFPDVKTTVITSGQATVTFPRTYLNASSGFQIPTGVTSAQVLVVGGGGGGGFDGGGGGGGGGVYQNSTLSVTPGSTYLIQVGAGGAAVNGYTGGSLACNGSWSGTVVGCISAAGGTSKFGSVSASGGGGGGGIEANGSSDSDASANVRGGGGGAGGQNSRSGLNSPGSGAFSGGSAASDNLNVGGGGGGSSAAAGSTGQISAAGNGAGGVTATLNSIIYGSGGAGGSFSSATLATGGSGAGDGGTSGVGPTSPVANRGSGGAGGGNGSTAVNARGTNGAAGIVIVRYALKGFATLSFTGTPTFRSLTTLTATVNTASKVTFYANDKKIPGCISVMTLSNIATCNWKPSTRGSITISLQVTPTDTNFTSLRQNLNTFFATARSGRR